LDIGNIIRQELTVKYPYDTQNQAMADKIMNTQSVGIHIRHGDNANSVALNHGVLPIDYYKQAVDLISHALDNPFFYIFSDDIPWAQSALDFLDHKIFVDWNGDLKNHEDFRLLSLCKHHIIANSTFSWWGAWLGKKENQMVFAPQKYYQKMEQKNPDLYPQTWKII
jgi:hypothetical protein